MTRAFELPFPPSVNSYWRAFRGRKILSLRAREFRSDCLDILSGQPPLPDEPLVGWLRLYPPTRRRYDADNYLKPVLDGLTHSGLITDDSLFSLVASQKCEVGGGYCHLFVETVDTCLASTKSFSWATLLETRSFGQPEAPL